MVSRSGKKRFFTGAVALLIITGCICVPYTATGSYTFLNQTPFVTTATGDVSGVYVPLGDNYAVLDAQGMAALYAEGNYALGAVGMLPRRRCQTATPPQPVPLLPIAPSIGECAEIACAYSSSLAQPIPWTVDVSMRLNLELHAGTLSCGFP